MKFNRLILAMCIIFTVALLTGCGDRNNLDDKSSGEIVDIDVETEENQASSSQILNLEELKARPAEASSVELKNIENQTLGMISDREEILSLIEDIFSYEVQDTLPSIDTEEGIIGPINFYFAGDEDIYGLVRDSFIYIEGYYFSLNQRDARRIQGRFEGNIAETPVPAEN